MRISLFSFSILSSDLSSLAVLSTLMLLFSCLTGGQNFSVFFGQLWSEGKVGGEVLPRRVFVCFFGLSTLDRDTFCCVCVGCVWFIDFYICVYVYVFVFNTRGAGVQRKEEGP